MLDESIFDWVNLPAGAKTISLWDSLHDGEICSVSSNLLERTVRIEFDVPYLRSFHRLPDDLRFVAGFYGVQSVRVWKWARWPGEFSIPRGITREEESKLMAEYHSKWREESESWNAFESSVAQDENGAEVSDATLAVADTDQVALNLGVRMPDDTYREVFLRAERFALMRSDAQELDVGKFLKLGEAYWTAFASRE